MARDLSGAMAAEQVIEIAGSFIEESLPAKTTLFLPAGGGGLKALSGPGGGSEVIAERFAWVAFEHGETVGPGLSYPDNLVLYLPLKAPMRVRGVLAIALTEPDWVLPPEQRQLMETVASLVAIVLERIHYVEVAQEALLRVESERLRNSLLSALSHDLRTPLTALVGLADSLAIAGSLLPVRERETAEAIRDEALRMSSLVSNLLDMARLQAGAVRLRKDWQPLEEVVGSSLNSLELRLRNHRVKVTLPADLPLLEFDAVLMERVFCNLLENAAKYTPPGSEVAIDALRRDEIVEIAVADNGPGLAPGSEEAIFEKFMRGRPESATPGVGLGLAICRSIVEAHRGRIRAENRPDLLGVDVAFLAANAVKIEDGGWFPLVFGAGVFTLLTTWKHGRELLNRRLEVMAVSLRDFVASIEQPEVVTVPGAAVFMTPRPEHVPHALLHNLKHNKVLHERMVLVTVSVVPIPRVKDSQRVVVERLSRRFFRVRIFFGFMEEADVPAALEWCAEQGLELEPMETSFFLGRETLLPKLGTEMALWREKLFAAMFRNSSSAAGYFKLPPNRVVELGSQVAL